MKTKQMNTAEAAPAQVAQHTPGPWRIAPRDTERRVIDTSGHSVAVATNRGIDSKPESFANARLIAAAPELLEACKKAMTCASLPDYVKDLIRAAIAKAEGKL